MIRSMTGFGKATADHAGATITIEISAVNHRFFDCSVRTPSAWASHEAAIKQQLKSKIGRGKVNVSVSRKRQAAASAPIVFDEGVAQAYIGAAERLSQLMGMGETVSIDTIANFEGVFTAQEAEEDDQALGKTIAAIVNEAVDQFDEARLREGAALAKDVGERIDAMETMIVQIEEALPGIRKRYAEKLRERVLELAEDTAVTEERLAVEIALMADKADVTEEIVRLKSHFSHGRELLADSEPIGRKLDFLSQEIQREINTLGVKTRDSDVARITFDLKSELEKIREQAANIE